MFTEEEGIRAAKFYYTGDPSRGQEKLEAIIELLNKGRELTPWQKGFFKTWLSLK